MPKLNSQPSNFAAITSTVPYIHQDTGN